MKARLLRPYEHRVGGAVCGICNRKVTWVRQAALGTVEYSMCRRCVEAWTKRGMVVIDEDAHDPVDRMCRALRDSPYGVALLNPRRKFSLLTSPA